MAVLVSLNWLSPKQPRPQLQSILHRRGRIVQGGSYVASYALQWSTTGRFDIREGAAAGCMRRLESGKTASRYPFPMWGYGEAIG